MKAKRISPHEVRVFLQLWRQSGWRSIEQIASAAGVARRTAHNHVSRLCADGVLEVLQAFPSYLYRLSEKQSTTGVSYMEQIQQARDAFWPK
jgi:predicted ArsR family transcriptional regulator